MRSAIHDNHKIAKMGSAVPSVYYD